ncbi:hypothetical protein K502DRAFT_354120 [Neoconidiobolus thromboides FSU 785]|nr:hypothetical protein K502DRAFT_354120 [Neoconidiobolus thromboides FSU 785]
MKADLDDCYEALEALNEEVIERDAHITEYRQYILTLKEDINELQEVLSSQQTEAITLRSETDKMLGLNLSLQNMVFKSKAKAVDMELKKIEANEASIHLKCIIPYLPKSFYENETDSLNFFLQLLRVYSKVELCGRQVCASHPITSIDTLIGGSGNDVMSLNTIVTHNFEFKHRLNQLNLILKSFISHVKSCSVPQYLSISRLSQDLTNIEGTVDTLLDEAKQELLVPSNHMSNIEKVVDNATYLRESYVTPNATHPLVKSSQALETLIALFNSQDLILSKMALINRSITSPTELDLFSKISDDERTLVNSDLLRPLNELMKVIFSFKSTLGSIQRFIDEKVDESTMIRSELQDIIISQYQNNEKIHQ